MASKRGPECDGSEESKKRRRGAFDQVKVFRFRRRQGYVCVPSQGGNTLGMEDSHYGMEVMSVAEHASLRRREALAAEASEAGPSASHNTEGELAIGSGLDQRTGASDVDEDFTSILLPVDSKERRVVLRRVGVSEIDVSEKEQC